MGGPERQTTPRTGLDDFVAGLLRYGTLGYLPQSLLQQLYPPVPGTQVGGLPPGIGGPGSEPLIPNTGGGGGGGLPMPLTPTVGGGGALQPQVSGGPMIEPTAGGGFDSFLAQLGLSPQAGAPAPNIAPTVPNIVPTVPNPPASLPGTGWQGWPGIVTGSEGGSAIPSGAVPFDIGQFIQGRLSLPQYTGQMTAGPNTLQNLAYATALQGLGGVNPQVGQSILSGLFSQAGQAGQIPPQFQQLLASVGQGGGVGSNLFLSNLAQNIGPASSLLNNLAMSSPTTGSPLEQFISRAAPNQIGALTGLGGANPAGQGISALLQQLSQPGAGVTSPLQQFLSVPTPERAALQSIADLGPATGDALAYLSRSGLGTPTAGETQAQSILGGLAGGQDLNALFSAINNARQQGLARDIGNIREQFSAGGAGLSTGLARAIAQRQSQSEQDYLSQIGQLGLSALPARTAAAQALAGTAGQAAGRGLDVAALLGQLGIGGQGSQIQALQAAGNLGLGAAGTGLGAAQGLTSANLADLTRGVDIGQILGSLGIGGQQAQAGALGTAGQLQLGATAGQQGAASGLLSAQLQDALQRGNIGQFIQSLSAQTAGQLGTQATQQQGLLADILNQSQARGLSALQTLPGAYSSIAQLPNQVAQGAGNIGEQIRQILQSGLTAQQQEFTRTQGSLFPTLLQYAAGAPQIYTPGLGQQLLGAGTTLGAAALGGK